MTDSPTNTTLAGRDDERRKFTVDDLLSIDEFPQYYGKACAFSPDRTAVCFAVIRSLRSGVRFDRQFLGGLDRAELHLFDLTRRTGRRLAGNAEQGQACFAPSWSPDGRFIAAASASTDDCAITPVLIEAATGRVTPMTASQSVDITVFTVDGSFLWLDRNRVAMPLLADGETPVVSHLQRRLFDHAAARWAESSRGLRPTADVLDSASFDAPQEPPPEWRLFDIEAHTLRALSDDERVETERLRAAREANPPAPPDPAGARARANDHPEWERVAVDESGRYAAFIAQDADATRLLVRTPDSPEPTIVFETNRWFRDIRAGETRRLACRGPAPGQDRLVDVLLPPDFSGTPVPAVVWIYPGSEVKGRRRTLHDISCPAPFNFQLLAAHGYAVIEVSMTDSLKASPPAIADLMADDVRAAVNAAVDAGYADPARLHVYGQSLGGWAAMMLLAHTSMFRSGIASAGISDPAALYTSLDPRTRYETTGSGRRERFELVGKTLCDNSWGIDAPPWAAADAYRAISPIAHADRITAPLLLLHGDADYVPLEQSERMFAALTRLKRTVRLVRYWGQDHVPLSPANIADGHRQRIDWLQST
ncbi:prolyl oligopeptidase family serine peptidase [Burkholderia sp. F1]|uniref:alpha/beta hydrolase family protein n=1 Tax=Burkholderia sp. F1 TaxID=3366817 RepID=UPI003D725935